MNTALQGRQILLCVCGGIAAYKSVELLRLLKKAEALVRVVMTQNAQAFVGPVTFEALSENPVYTGMFQGPGDGTIRHIQWAREADAVIIAPATANIIGKLAGGIADDAMSTLLLAVTAPKLICPAMNTHMFQHPAVRRNLDMLRQDGDLVLAPGAGELACGTSGMGRMPEPAEILDRLEACLCPKDLTGRTVLVSAGPTREFMDPVRYVSNPSSGKMGFAVARAAEHRGADVILVSGPTHLPAPVNTRFIPVQSAAQMADAVLDHFAAADAVIKAAAVSDYTPRAPAAHKIKKGALELTVTFEKTQDILKTLSERKQHQVLIGFAAETQDLERNAAEKLARKNLDMIVGNYVGTKTSGFEHDTNQATFFFKDGAREQLPQMTKTSLAHLLLDHVAAKLCNR